MKRIRFLDGSGSVRTGEWTDGDLYFGGQTYTTDEVEILPPSVPEKIVGTARNYVDHAEEAEKDVPEEPSFFFKTPNTLSGHGDTVPIPSGVRVDYEGELAVVVKDQCRNVSRDAALDHVEGFTCANDVSIRGHGWIKGKSFDNSCPIGPYLVPPAELDEDASLEVRVNGEIKQQAAVSQMVFSVETLVSEVTSFLTLEPGDVILTGTPSGISPLDDGDVVEIEIEGVGTLEHDVRTSDSIL